MTRTNREEYTFLFNPRISVKIEFRRSSNSFSDSIRKASPPASEVVELLLPPAGGAAPAESRRRFETGSWKIVPASYLLSLSGEEPLAECRTLVDAGVLLTLYGTEEELLRAETFDKYPGLV